MASQPKQAAKTGHPVLKAVVLAGVSHLVVSPLLKRLWLKAREYLTHWAIAGLIVTATGIAPDHWVAHLVDDFHVPAAALHLWAANLDFRWLAAGAGLLLVVGDIAWRRTRPAPAKSPAAMPEGAAQEALAAPALPDKPSIAVLPFGNLSGDPAQEYFSDGITEDIITELSRFRELFVISRNSSFSYKGKPSDVRQVARELGVRYVLEGSARKSGDRVRVNAQLIDALYGSHLWAEHYEHTLDDVFAVQEEVTRGIVTAVAPEVALAEVAHASHASPNDNAQRLTWRAQGLMNDAVRQGRPAPLLEAIDLATQSTAADPTALATYNVLAWANFSRHLNRWGADPELAQFAMAAAVERMMTLSPLDHRTLLVSGVLRVLQGEPDRGLADLRRALEVNPNSSQSLMWLALCEAMAGQSGDARTHAMLSLRLNPRDPWVGVAHVALAMVSFQAMDYVEAARLAELAIQSEPAVPLRRALMIACCARLGDIARAEREMAVLNGFAPDFISGLFRGDFPVFRRSEDMAHLLSSLRLAGTA